jgi:ubiquinone/menaquinone biosynthesis C-methylase UbiE
MATTTPTSQLNRSSRTRAEEALRRYWDDDAATYDRWREHGAWSAGERAAWAAVLARRLPPVGAKVLDVCAGTGFLSLAAARMGYEVTALDISPGMLARLEQTAAHEALTIKLVCASAHEPPSGPFDAVMERLALWTLPDPEQALAAWREVAAGGLIAFECMIGRDYVEGLRRRARKFLARVRGLPAEHRTAEPEVRRALPPMGDTSPSAFVQLIEAAGWRSPHLMRLRDVEWARQVALPPLDRLVGVTPEYVITAT